MMDAKISLVSLVIMFAVRPICAQDDLFKMSSVSPDYSDVTWAPEHLKSLLTQLFVQQLLGANEKGNIEEPIIVHFLEESTASNADSVFMS